jgi:hypothetical protein
LKFKILIPKKATMIKSPDISKLQEVIIDRRTRIYITPGADIEEARNRYMSRNSYRRLR